MNSIREAAALVATSTPMKAAYPIPPLPDLVDLLIKLFQALNLCNPSNPDAAYRYLTYRPFWGLRLVGRYRRELNAYRAQIESHMARQWRGTADGFRAFADSVWDRVDNGDVTRDLITGCCEDAQGQ